MGQEFSEGRHPGEAILSEANKSRSRDNTVIESGSGVVEAGTVLAAGAAAGEMKPAGAADTGIAVIIAGVDASTVAVPAAVIARDAEMNGACLVFEASVDTDAEKAAKVADLAAKGVIVR